MKVQPDELVGAWQCLDCLRVERRVTVNGCHKNKAVTRRTLKRKCFLAGCPCPTRYHADGQVLTLGALP